MKASYYKNLLLVLMCLCLFGCGKPEAPELNLDMLWCKPGTFMMGSPEDEKGRQEDETQYEVTLTKGFWLGKYEVTQAEFEKIMRSSPSSSKGESLPVEKVTWFEADEYCRKVGKRLPTEVEWEKAARGSQNYLYGYGPDFEPGRCNTPFRGEDGAWRRLGTTTSGSHPQCASDYGVVDMIGNVWEFTDGWYDETEGWHVVRGGSWFNSLNFARADGRYGRNLSPEYSLDLIGFRCCRSVEKTAPQD